jgi:hypothetical protein
MTAINRWYSYPTVAVIQIDIHPAVPTRMKQAPTPERSLGNQRQTGSAIVLGHLIPLPHDSLGVGERAFDQVIT